MRTTALFFLLLSCSAFAGETLPSLLSQGSWQLTKTSKGPISVLSIREYTAVFNKDGTWIYTAKMAGQFEGMEKSGRGTWRVEGSTLFYTAGDNEGESKIEIIGSTLSLTPDPVLFLNGVEQIGTIYHSAR